MPNVFVDLPYMVTAFDLIYQNPILQIKQHLINWECFIFQNVEHMHSLKNEQSN
jgi:hypothetical protein